jgi:Domain of unknown function (DUF4157)
VSRSAVKAAPEGGRRGARAQAAEGEAARGRRAVAGRVLDLHGSYGNSFVSRLLGGAPIQRACGCGGGCCSSPAEKTRGVVQRAPLAGSPLPSTTQSTMEGSFGRDFSGVRVHTGPEAQGMARDLGARAFTSGSDVYFGAGQFAPSTPAGQGLIAHELTHVAQQRAGAAPVGGIDTPGDVFEREAEAAAAAVMSGKKPSVGLSDGSGAVRRAPDGDLKGRMAEEVVVDRQLEIPGLKASGHARDDIQARFQNAAETKALRTTKAGRSREEGTTTQTLWNKWASTRPFTVRMKKGKTEKELSPAELIDLKKKHKCQVDHIIELQVGGADDPNNMRLLTGTRNMTAGSQLAGTLRKLTNEEAKGDEDLILRFKSVKVLPGAPDPDCLDWELDLWTKGSALVSPVAGAEAVETAVGGNEASIFYKTGDVVEESAYAVPGFQLKKVAGDKAPWVLRGPISPHVRRIPVLKPKPEYEFEVAKEGAPIKLTDRKLKAEFPFLSEAELDMTVEEGAFRADGVLKPTHPLLKHVIVELHLADDEFSAKASVTPEQLKAALPVPGLEITEASLGISYAKGSFVATGGFALKYTTVAEGRVDAKFGAKGFEALGALVLHVPGLSEAKGQVWVREGKLGGRIDVGADKLKLPGVKSAKLTVTIEDGQLAGEGTLDLSVPGVKQAKIGFGVDAKGNYAITGEAALSIPGTDDAKIGLTYKDGDLEGFGRVALKIPGLESAAVELRYAKGLVSGSGEVAYKKGKLAGKVTVALSEKGKLSGGGELSYEIAPGLVAFVGMQIREDGTTKVSGGLRVPETIDIFPRKEVEKELFKLPTIEIPIFAIPLGTRSAGLVATIDARIVARAGVGPGQLRKVKILADFDPSAEEGGFAFQASAELYVPASAELGVAIAAGLGLSVAIARAVGGLEAEGAAGIAAEFVADTLLKYEAGQFAVTGAAELSAMPKLVFRLKAFVKVEVDLWITTIEVYRKDWILAQRELGSSLKVGVRVPFKYVFGEPFDLALDQIEFIVPKLEPSQLVKELLPA